MKNVLKVGVLGLISILLAACAPENKDAMAAANSAQVSAAAPTPNAFEGPAMAILQQKCATCHTPTAGPRNVKDIANPTSLVQSGLVIPGQPLTSPLFIAINSGKMPPGGNHLTPDEIKTIESWIMALEPSVAPTAQ